MTSTDELEDSGDLTFGYEVVTTTGEETIAALREAVKKHSIVTINGSPVDAYSASMIVLVYDAVNEANKAKLREMDVARMARVAFTAVNRVKEMRC